MRLHGQHADVEAQVDFLTPDDVVAELELIQPTLSHARCFFPRHGKMLAQQRGGKEKPLLTSYSSEVGRHRKPLQELKICLWCVLSTTP